MRYRVSFDADARNPKDALIIVVRMLRNLPPNFPQTVVLDWLIEDVDSGQRFNCKASIQHICEGKLRNIRVRPES